MHPPHLLAIAALGLAAWSTTATPLANAQQVHAAHSQHLKAIAEHHPLPRDNGDDDNDDGEGNQRAAQPFDFYILALSWQPGFCRMRHRDCPFRGQCPGCAAPRSYWRSHMTLHGLWPERKDGTYPQNCAKEALDADQVEAAIGLEDLETYWPNVKVPEGEDEYASFWDYEWEKHGTCSGLDQVTFITKTVDILRKGAIATPSLLQDHVGQKVSASALRGAFGGLKAALQCGNRDFPDDLTEVRTCWNKDANNMPTTQFSCPQSVLRDDTCKGNQVYIRAFK